MNLSFWYSSAADCMSEPAMEPAAEESKPAKPAAGLFGQCSAACSAEGDDRLTGLPEKAAAEAAKLRQQQDELRGPLISIPRRWDSAMGSPNPRRNATGTAPPMSPQHFVPGYPSGGYPHDVYR